MITKIFNNFLASALLYKKQNFFFEKKGFFLKNKLLFFVILFLLTKLFFGVPVEHSLLEKSESLARNRVRNSYKI